MAFKYFKSAKKLTFTSREGLRSASDNGGYVAFVEQALADHAVFAQFKKSPVYQQILEHTSEEQARQYLEIIAAQTPQFQSMWDKFAVNDLVGGANVVHFSEHCRLSPSTLRYVKVASDLQHLFGDSLQGAHVAEIGVGYGGQRLVLDQLYRFGSYAMFDLPAVLGLVSKYLESHLLQSSYQTKTLNAHDGAKAYDLVISNYAFSELPTVVQRVYVEKVLKQSARGYLTMNSGTPESLYADERMSLDEIRSIIPNTRILAENPLSFPGNYLLVWG
jgi:putative sugar O-methyltransferase